MRIISLSNYLTDTVIALGLEGQLVAVSCDSILPEGCSDVQRLESLEESAMPAQNNVLDGFFFDIRKIAQLAPDLVLAPAGTDDELEDLSCRIKGELEILGVESVKVRLYAPKRLSDVFALIEDVGKRANNAAKGHDLAQRYQSQLLDWARNFYDRTHHKRVSFLASVDPFILAGGWISDMISECSAVPQLQIGAELLQQVSWEEIVKFRPDVLIVALRGVDLNSTLRSFKQLQLLPSWEDLLAVKRGEVFFADGETYFYKPGPKIVGSMGILVSAIAGMDSGYITPRDSFFRLRWLELMRHKF